jgi:hypothetical protein
MRGSDCRALAGACVFIAACAQPATSTSDDDDGASSASTSASTTSTSTTSTTSTGSGGACPTPSGTPGVHQGELVDPALSWQGYVHDEPAASTIEVANYYDCNGSLGINALVITQSAMWCGPCQADAVALQEKLDGEWNDLGVRALTLMVEDGVEQPATLDTASNWKGTLALGAFDVAVDPGYTFDAFDYDKHISHSGFPVHLLVDPRTMLIVKRSDTSDGLLPLSDIQSLAMQNQ